MIIATTGYHGTGSSAVLDLLSEYEGCSEGGLKSYEHVPLYFPNGVFDLEHKLLWGNDLHRSDEAIKSFRQAMYELNDVYFGWFGSYRYFYDEQFKVLVDTFLRNITQFTCDGEWYNYYENKIAPAKLVKDMIKTVIPGKTVHGMFGRDVPKLIRRPVELSFVSEEEFYGHAKEFVRGYCNMVNRENAPVLLLDHMLFPHNAYKIENYFDDDFRLIIVDRDIRDMFISCKYVWTRMGFDSPYPVDAEMFLRHWTNMRNAERAADHPHVMRVQFEDLVYKYDETVAKIEVFTGLKPEQHVRAKTRFVPERSINNTQVFRIQKDWEAEVEVFAGRTEDIYQFPYERTADIDDTFDS